MKALKRIRNYQYLLMGFMIFYLIASFFDKSDANINMFSVVFVVLMLMVVGCSIFYSVSKELVDKINKLEKTLNKEDSRDS